MQRFDLPSLVLLLLKIQQLQAAHEHHIESGTGNQRLDSKSIDDLARLIDETFQYCDSVGFEDGRLKASEFRRSLQRTRPFDSSAIEAELRGLYFDVMKSVQKYHFFQIEQKVGHLVDRDIPFGLDVELAFPSIGTDLIDAGNCIAANLNVAAAFHLMRVAEVGLWELGRDRQIPLAQTGKIEFTEWGLIIGELQTAVQAIQQWPNSRAKEDAHRFYNSSLVEIRAFNDGWRRHAVHPRPFQPRMQTDEAVALWGHVERFMKTLASKIGEGKYTPLVWS